MCTAGVQSVSWTSHISLPHLTVPKPRCGVLRQQRQVEDLPSAYRASNGVKMPSENRVEEGDLSS